MQKWNVVITPLVGTPTTLTDVVELKCAEKVKCFDENGNLIIPPIDAEQVLTVESAPHVVSIP